MTCSYFNKLLEMQSFIVSHVSGRHALFHCLDDYFLLLSQVAYLNSRSISFSVCQSILSHSLSSCSPLSVMCSSPPSILRSLSLSTHTHSTQHTESLTFYSETFKRMWITEFPSAGQCVRESKRMRSGERKRWDRPQGIVRYISSTSLPFCFCFSLSCTHTLSLTLFLSLSFPSSLRFPPSSTLSSKQRQRYL